MANLVLPKTDSAKPALVELRRVGKTFHSDSGTAVRALEDANLTVAQGQFVTLLGATGGGKTTLLNLVAGIEKPDAGTLRLGDGVHLGRDIAYVFQHYTLFPWRTTSANVSFGLQMRGLPRRRRRAAAAELLARVGLAGFEKAYPHELSGGMRQRAAIAQALAIQPKLLLMDEPFGAVDDATRMELQRMLIELWRHERMTVLFVTHNIDEALVLGSQVVVLSGRPGRIRRRFEVNLPHPRDKTSTEFTHMFIKIRQSLSQETDE